jgi:hypothetical protein
MLRRDSCLGVMCDGVGPAYQGGGGGHRWTLYSSSVGAGPRRRRKQRCSAPPPPACGRGCREGSLSTLGVDDMALHWNNEKEDRYPLFFVRHQYRIGTTVSTHTLDEQGMK